jgi:hypothetical protein
MRASVAVILSVDSPPSALLYHARVREHVDQRE